MKANQTNKIDPLLIQSWFDNELDVSDMDSELLDEISRHPMVDALHEMRALVRAENEDALKDLDSASMWAAISDAIDDQNSVAHRPSVECCAVVRPSHSSISTNVPVAAPRPSVKARVLHWMPAIVGAALFLIGLPGLVTMIQQSDNETAVANAKQTVVYVNPGAVDPAGVAQPNINLAAHAIQPENTIQRSRIAMPDDADNSRLTVDEMDTAIRVLMQRLETLEKQNQERIEQGQAPIIYDLPFNM